MKKLLLLLLISCQSLLAQNTETRTVSAFHAIKIGQAIEAVLEKGDKESVRIETDGIKTENVTTTVEDGKLKISLDNGSWFEHNWFSSHKAVKVWITYVKLDGIYASSASKVLCNDVVNASKIKICASSAAKVDAQVNCSELETEVSSAAKIYIKGKTENFEAEGSSAGKIEGNELQSSRARVDASSAAKIQFCVSKELEAEASSGASIQYSGSPEKTNIESSSGGAVKKL